MRNRRTQPGPDDKPKAPLCPSGKQPKKLPAKKLPIRKSAGAVVRNWLIRMTRVHAHLCYTVRLFAQPEIAGGQSLEGEAYSARAAREDRTLIHDACVYGMDELGTILAEVQAAMDLTSPTTAQPGSPDKIAEMCRRIQSGQSPFNERDAR